MQKHRFPAWYSKKSYPVVWLSDQSWHTQIYPSTGSTTFLATSSEHLLTMEIIWGLGFFSQNLSFPCSSIRSTWLQNIRLDAMATGCWVLHISLFPPMLGQKKKETRKRRFPRQPVSSATQVFRVSRLIQSLLG